MSIRGSLARKDPRDRIRVNPRPSAVATPQRDTGAHHEPHRLEQKHGKFGEACRRFLIRDIREIRSQKPELRKPQVSQMNFASVATPPSWRGHLLPLHAPYWPNLTARGRRQHLQPAATTTPDAPIRFIAKGGPFPARFFCQKTLA